MRSPRPYSRDSFSESSAARTLRRSAAPAASPRVPIPGDSDEEFPLGATVRHPMFGTGRILGREGKGATLKLTIHFVGYGPKKILPAYTTLQRVDGR